MKILLKTAINVSQQEILRVCTIILFNFYLAYKLYLHKCFVLEKGHSFEFVLVRVLEWLWSQFCFNLESIWFSF